MTPTQCRIARAALGWSETELAKAANVGVTTVSRFELSQARPQAASIEAIRHALETAGIILLDEGEMAEGGIGVRLKNSVQPQAEEARQRVDELKLTSAEV